MRGGGAHDVKSTLSPLMSGICVGVPGGMSMVWPRQLMGSGTPLKSAASRFATVQSEVGLGAGGGGEGEADGGGGDGEADGGGEGGSRGGGDGEADSGGDGGSSGTGGTAGGCGGGTGGKGGGACARQTHF